MNSLKVLVIIPAYNEENTIHNVIQKIKQAYKCDIVVINDGSTDSTAKIASNHGARVINHPFNLGIGGAMQTGYQFAKQNNYDIAIQIDADGQHDPIYIEKLVNHMTQENFDMVIGSRYVNKTSYKSCLSRRIGMVFFSFIIWMLTGQKIKDTTSGFRAVNKHIIDYFAANYPADYPEVDVLVRLYKKNYKISELSVEMSERQGGVSSITPFKSLYYMVKVSLSLVINYLRPGEMS